MLDRMRRQLEDVGGMEGPTGGGLGTNVDVADRGDEFEVTADVPGFERDDIDLRVADGTLHISAQRSETAGDSDADYIRQERRDRSVGRSVRLPEPVEAEEASAQYRNGVLSVTLPKAGPSSGESIDID